MDWRLINDIPRHAFLNMAIDEAIAESVRMRLSPPALRIYGWAKPSVSIGYFQKFSDFNVDYCRSRGYPFVRRLTGGTAILHDNEMTYSFSSRSDYGPFRGGILENYLAISSAIVHALNALRINTELNRDKKKINSPFCFTASSYGEVAVGGKKIVGSAQKRYRNGFLQQGTFLMKAETAELARILNHDNGSHDLRGIGSIQDCSPALSVDDLKKAFIEAVQKTFGVNLVSGGITKDENHRALQLVKDKYSTDRWNFRR